MNVRSILVGAFASMALCAGAVAAEPRIGKFVSYEMEEFTIYTTRSGDQARQFIEDLAKYRVTLEKTLGKRAQKNTVPTRIVILSSTEWEKYLQPRQNVAGWFQAWAQRGWIVDIVPGPAANAGAAGGKGLG